MNFLRHCFFMLGENEKQSLEHCKLYDSQENDIQALGLLKELMDKCKDNKKIEYVRRILQDHILK